MTAHSQATPGLEEGRGSRERFPPSFPHSLSYAKAHATWDPQGRNLTPPCLGGAPRLTEGTMETQA